MHPEHLVGAEIPLDMQIPTPGQAPAGMSPFHDPVQGLTLLQDSAIPVHWASVGQQDHDCLHGVVPAPAAPPASPSTGKLRHREGKQTAELDTHKHPPNLNFLPLSKLLTSLLVPTC